MNKLQIAIGAIIIVVLAFFGYNSYQMIGESNSNYQNKTQKKVNKANNALLPIEVNEMYGSSGNNENSSKGKPIFEFVSTSNDLENETDILQTNYEITYHTFDFNDNTISMKTSTEEGEWLIHTFRIKKSSVKESLSGLKGMEFEIDDERCKQIWVSSLGNIGYEFYNGQTLVFYNVEEI